MVRVGRPGVIAQDKVTFNLQRNGLISRANFCNSRLRGSYRVAASCWPLFAVLIGAVTGAFGSRLSIAFNVSRSDPDRADVGSATGGDRRFRGR